MRKNKDELLVEYLKNEGEKNDYEVNNNIINAKGAKNDMLTNYLDSCIGKKLFKDEQEELKSVFKKSGLTGRTMGINTLNGILKDENLPYEILPKRTKSERYWIIADNVDR